MDCERSHVRRALCASFAFSSLPAPGQTIDGAPATLDVQQLTVGAAGGPFHYELTDDAAEPLVQLGVATTTAEGEQIGAAGLGGDLAPGTYTLRQDLAQLPTEPSEGHWEFSGVECDGATVEVDSAERGCDDHPRGGGGRDLRRDPYVGRRRSGSRAERVDDDHNRSRRGGGGSDRPPVRAARDRQQRRDHGQGRRGPDRDERGQPVWPAWCSASSTTTTGGTTRVPRAPPTPTATAASSCPNTAGRAGTTGTSGSGCARSRRPRAGTPTPRCAPGQSPGGVPGDAVPVPDRRRSCATGRPTAPPRTSWRARATTTGSPPAGSGSSRASTRSLPAACGLDVALILDLSGSVGSDLPNLKHGRQHVRRLARRHPVADVALLLLRRLTGRRRHPELPGPDFGLDRGRRRPRSRARYAAWDSRRRHELGSRARVRRGAAIADLRHRGRHHRRQPDARTAARRRARGASTASARWRTGSSPPTPSRPRARG